MIVNNELLGTKTAVYSVGEEAAFNAAIENAKPARLHTFCNVGLFGLGANWSASFVDQEGNVHGYITMDLNDGFAERVKPIYDTIKGANIPEVDGKVEISDKNGHVYQVFQTDSPSKPERVGVSYDAWIDAVRTLPVEGTLIQYLRNESQVAIDATRGKMHLVTMIDENDGRTLESTLMALRSPKNPDGQAEVLDRPAYQTRDNQEVVNWYLDLVQK